MLHLILALFVIFLVLLALGIPIYVSMAVASLAASVLNPVITTNADYVARTLVAGLDVQSMLAVPLFILSGILMAKGGISKRLFDFFAYFLGNMTAGLPIAAVITCLFYGAISGSAPATVAAVGAMCIPILLELNYDKGFVTALVTVSGSLGVIIPPSIPFIMFGLATGESVGNLFISGVLPGILIALCLIVYTFLYCKFRGEDKKRIAENTKELRKNGFLHILQRSFWAILSPVIILGGIYSGIVTPTEAAGISVIYALLVSMLIYRTVTVKDLWDILVEGAATVAPIMIVVSAATVFGRVLTMTNAATLIAQAVTGAVSSKVAVILMVNVLLLVVGCLMDTTPAILILAPILMPIMQSYGMSGIHFGCLMIVNLAIGFVTPPVGLNLYVASSMTKLPVLKIAKNAMPFIAAFIVALLLISFVPWFSTALL